MSVHFDQIVPWGRLREEYELMLDLSEPDLSRGVLDCGGGPSSFTAEVVASGYRAVSVDPIYAHSGNEIRARFEATAHTMMAQVRATPDDWVWGFHRNPEGLMANRRAALERFLADYDAGLREQRYIVGELPKLPVPDRLDSWFVRTCCFFIPICSRSIFTFELCWSCVVLLRKCACFRC